MELRRYDGIMKEWENMLPDSSYCGYMGMYYCNHKWYGDWFQIAENTFSETDHANLASLCLEIAKLWPDGCDWNMRRLSNLKQILKATLTTIYWRQGMKFSAICFLSI